MRFPRTLSEAFPQVRFPAVERYRYSWRWTKPICEALFVVTLSAAAGVAAFLYLSR